MTQVDEIEKEIKDEAYKLWIKNRYTNHPDGIDGWFMRIVEGIIKKTLAKSQERIKELQEGKAKEWNKYLEAMKQIDKLDTTIKYITIDRDRLTESSDKLIKELAEKEKEIDKAKQKERSRILTLISSMECNTPNMAIIQRKVLDLICK